MKFLVTTITLMAGLNASADLTLKGDWCIAHGDFTDMLLIDGQGNYLAGLVGNEALEVLFPVSGYISNGASGMNMTPSMLGESNKFVEARVENILFGKKIKLNFADGTVLIYKNCRRKSKEVVAKLKSLSQ